MVDEKRYQIVEWLYENLDEDDWATIEKLKAAALAKDDDKERIRSWMKNSDWVNVDYDGKTVQSKIDEYQEREETKRTESAEPSSLRGSIRSATSQSDLDKLPSRGEIGRTFSKETADEIIDEIETRASQINTLAVEFESDMVSRIQGATSLGELDDLEGEVGGAHTVVSEERLLREIRSRRSEVE